MALNKNLHLLRRSGFGPTIEGFHELESVTKEALWKNIKAAASGKPDLLVCSNRFVQENYYRGNALKMTAAEKAEFNRKIRNQSNKDLKELNDKWIHLMSYSQNQLLEKMSLFWHDHFAIRQNNSFLQEEAINTIRTHALGNFGNLLREVSKSGAMIVSLNNQQNKKSAPNENFAREILELFSMGMGNYTEKDIKESARAFTGWSIRRDGKFMFKPENHDKGIKEIFGNSGRFNGDDVIDIILKQPQTAIFIVSKIYKYFVNEHLDRKKINELALDFRKDYEILPLLDKIFMSDWFYDEKNLGTKVKSPVELIVGIQRFSPFDQLENRLQMPVQKILGQILFHPPSIAGWPSSKGWIDSSTIMVRLQLANILNGTAGVRLRGKTDDDTNMGRDEDEINIERKKDRKKNMNADDRLSALNNEQILSGLISSKISTEKLSLLSKASKKEWAVGLMSLPEYQLC